MKALEFCYSLQGFAELTLCKSPTKEQWAAICAKAQAVDLKDDECYSGKMSPLNFATWLIGFIEISEAKVVTEKQWKIVREHLSLVFTKVTKEDLDEPSNVDFEDILDKIKKEADKKKPWVWPVKPWPSDPFKPSYEDAYILRCASHTEDLICANQ